jgi:hypothetical protein
MILFQPLTHDPEVKPWIRIIDTISNRQMPEAEYFDMIRQIVNRRNPHTAIGEDIIDEDDE